MVINKSVDLLHRADLTELKKCIKSAAEIKQVKIQWAEKIKQHLEKGYTEKEAANLKADSVKLKLLELLKQESPPGPFTTAEDVTKYMKMNVIPEKKNKRMHIEIRYARLNSLSLKPTSSVFNSKGNIKIQKHLSMPITSYHTLMEQGLVELSIFLNFQMSYME